MNRVMIAMIFLALLLSGTIVIEMLQTPGKPAEGMASLAAAGPDGTTRMDEANPARMMETILARPLFRADRRPSSAEGSLAQSGQPADLPRLTGIIMANGARKAIFQPSENVRPIIVDEGQMIGVWRVRQIAADTVTLAGPKGVQTLEPRFDPNARSAGAPNIPTFTPPPVAVNSSVQPKTGPNGPIQAVQTVARPNPWLGQTNGRGPESRNGEH